MKNLTFLLAFAATPAMAASGPFLSLSNTDFVVLLAFILFVAVLLRFNVPAILNRQLDARAEGIQNDLDEARALREEAKTVLAEYERKQKEVQTQAEGIVAAAKEEARAAAELAKADLQKSIERRIAGAQDQIASAEAAAVKEVRDTAITVAIGAARDVIAANTSAADGNKLIDDSIKEVGAKLH
ncbi:F0F1 ATP synthase subunit B [Falsihalocynthiibacter sp. SS001]|uniref:F0F1 ATP synthase subunit B n=1 Tax=Falsihalocynthiibacter sp. SS001 TaxID=3349698 RepID=UPI0036D342AB